MAQAPIGDTVDFAAPCLIPTCSMNDRASPARAAARFVRGVGCAQEDLTCPEHGLGNVLEEARTARDKVLREMMDITDDLARLSFTPSLLFVPPIDIAPPRLSSSPTHHQSLPLLGGKVLHYRWGLHDSSMFPGQGWHRMI